MTPPGIFFFSIVVVSFLFVIAAVVDVVNAHEGINASMFSYTGPNGPEHWGSLSPTCASGKSQSPINIVNKAAVPNKNLKPITRDYKPVNTTLVNRGFNIALHFEGPAGTMNLDGKILNLKGIHWHAPSEHKINGVQFAAELHAAHEDEAGSLSVVSILYKEGPADPFIAKIQKGLDELAKEKRSANEEPQIPLGIIDIKQVKTITKRYFRYIGSLTTPPCTENVIWIVIGKVRTISKEQVKALQAPLDAAHRNNCRPVQPLNGRKVELCNGREE